MEQYADSLDRAAAEQELELQANLQAALNKKAGPMPLVGKCYNCDEPLEGLRFCDADCRDDYQRRINRRRINGH